MALRLKKRVFHFYIHNFSISTGAQFKLNLAKFSLAISLIQHVMGYYVATLHSIRVGLEFALLLF